MRPRESAVAAGLFDCADKAVAVSPLPAPGRASASGGPPSPSQGEGVLCAKGTADLPRPAQRGEGRGEGEGAAGFDPRIVAFVCKWCTYAGADLAGTSRMTFVEAVKPSPEDAVAVLCGPPVMIEFTLASLKRLGFRSDDVYTTLENRMKCGIGKCGRCNVGPVYICKEGPVFTASEVEALPPEM